MEGIGLGNRIIFYNKHDYKMNEGHIECALSFFTLLIFKKCDKMLPKMFLCYKIMQKRGLTNDRRRENKNSKTKKC